MRICGIHTGLVALIICVVCLFVIIECVAWYSFGFSGAVLAFIVIVLLAGASIGPTAHCGK